MGWTSGSITSAGLASPDLDAARQTLLAELREDFVGSTEFDRHYVLDLVSGTIELGPAIRETDGGWTQYGAVPPKAETGSQAKAAR